MANIKIGNRNDVFIASKAHTTYTLEAGKHITSSGIGLAADGQKEGMRFVVDGRISAPDAGIAWGYDAPGIAPVRIDIGETGRIASDSVGIWVNGDGDHIDNAGRVTGYLGISAQGEGTVIVNSGKVVGNGYGITTLGEQRIINSGEITGGHVGIGLDITGGDTGSFIKNTGTITGGYAVMGSLANDRIVNTGTIDGAVDLRDGADVFVVKGGIVNGQVDLSAGADTFIFKGGMVDGEVLGGEGDDRYVIGKAGLDIAEKAEGGFDIVKSSISFTLGDNLEQLFLTGRKNLNGTGNDDDNHVQGNAGNNVLSGGNGFDFLMGGKGNDRLIGGLDGDYFNFQPGSGKDTVMDFEVNADEIQIGGLKGAIDFADMMANHVSENNGDTWITYGHDIVVLKDIAMGDLKSGDFNFG